MKTVRLAGIIAVLILVGAYLWKAQTPSTPATPPHIETATSPESSPTPSPEKPPAPAETTNVPNQPDEEILLETASITGRVYNVKTNQGMSGVEIVAQGRNTYSALTNEDGIYEITSLHPGNWEVFTHSNKGNLGFPSRFASRHLTIFTTDHTKGPDFGIDVGYFISGHVKDELGNPISEASVTLRGIGTHGRTRTNVDGEFRFIGAPQDHPMSVIAAKVGFAQAESESIEIPHGGKGTFDLILQTGSSVAGRIVDQDELPVPWSELTLYDENWNRISAILNHGHYGSINGIPVRPGEFHVRCLGAGTYSLFAHQKSPPHSMGSEIGVPPFHSEGDTPNAVVTLAKGEHKKNVVVTMDIVKPESEDLMTIGGAVRNEEGEPVADVRISYRSVHVATTDSEGQYRAEFLPERRGNQVLMVYAKGYKPTHKKIEPNDGHTLDFELIRTSTIRGQVLDAYTQKPIFGYLLGKIRPAGKRPPWEIYYPSYVSNVQGRFSAEYINDFPVSVEIHADGYLPKKVNVESREHAKLELIIEMEPGPRIAGQVIDTDGKPVSDARIYIESLPNEMSFNPNQSTGVHAFADSEGRFWLSVLTSEIEKIFAFHSDYGSASTPVDLVSGKLSEITIQLPIGGSLSGGVYWQGNPIPHQKIEVGHEKERNRMKKETTTDQNGQYRFTGLIPGKWTAKVRHAVYTSDNYTDQYVHNEEFKFAMDDDGTANHDFSFGQSNTTISGKIDGVDFHLDEVVIRLYAEGNGSGASARIHEDGWYQFEYIPALEYRVIVTASRSGGVERRKQTTVTLVDGKTTDLNISLESIYSVKGKITCPDNVTAIFVAAKHGTLTIEDFDDGNFVATNQRYSNRTYALNLPEPGIYTIVASPQYADRTMKSTPTLAVIEVLPNEVYKLNFDL
jgi:uncharacterized GH25 family protein